MAMHVKRGGWFALLAATTTGALGLTVPLSGGAAQASAPVVIKAELPQQTGPITAGENKTIAKLTAEYEKAHPGVTVDWLPNNYSSITLANAGMEAQAAGGSAPDLVWEQYQEIVSGSIPAGLLQNIKPYLEKPNPYVAGNKSWLSLFQSSVIPYMTSANGNMDIILGSAVESGMFYNKASFAKAGIKAAPKTWAMFMSDLAKLKKTGVSPFIFADGGLCNPPWYERLAATSLLANQVRRFDVDHSPVTTGLDVAVGIHKGILSMKNPRYAEGWKLLGELAPYSYSGASTYDACSSPTASTPPLDSMTLLTQGKVAIVWGGSWYIPELNSAGFKGKYGVFPEPTITKATTPYALNTNTVGVIGGPDGIGTWSVTSQKADSSMTPAKTKVVMNFLAWLFTPKHLGAWIDQSQSGADVPTENGAPVLNIPGLKSLLPTKKVPTVVYAVLDSELSSAAANSGLRLVQDYMNGSLTYPKFADQWQALLTASAQAYAKAHHVNLNKY